MAKSAAGAEEAITTNWRHRRAPLRASPRSNLLKRVVRNQNPALPAEPTLVGPPDIVMPQSDKLGDPMANILNPPSMEPAAEAASVAEKAAALGPERARALGKATGAGLGEASFVWVEVYQRRGPVYDPDPEYSEERARQNSRER